MYTMDWVKTSKHTSELYYIYIFLLYLKNGLGNWFKCLNVLQQIHFCIYGYRIDRYLCMVFSLKCFA